MKSRAPIVAILVSVLLAVAFFFLLYKPRSDEQTALEAETTTLLAQQVELNNEITRLREIEANQVEIAAQLARLDEYIPAGMAQPAFVRELQSNADASGLELSSVTFGEPVLVDGAPSTGESDSALVAIPVTVYMDGGYFQAVDLLRRLESDVTRAVQINSVNMVEAEDGFPAISTTWIGELYAVAPVVTGSAAPADTEATDAAADPAADPAATPSDPAVTPEVQP